MPHLSPEIRAWRIAHGLPPEPEPDLATFLADRLGPVAVPTGTTERPPMPIEARYRQFLEASGRLAPQQSQGVSLTEAAGSAGRATPATVAEFLPGETGREFRALRQRVGPIEAFRLPAEEGGVRFPSAKVSPSIAQAIQATLRRQIPEPFAGKIAQALTPEQLGVKGALEMFAQPDVLIPAVRPMTRLGVKGVQETGRAAIQAAEKAAPAARRLATEEVGAVGKVAKVPLPLESPQIQAGLKAWRENLAYVDGAGNYHLRTVPGQGTGPIAPWNKEAKATFPSSKELHAASGYGTKPITNPVASEALSPAAKPAQATEGVATMAERIRKAVADVRSDVPLQERVKQVIENKPQVPVGAEARAVSESVGRLAGEQPGIAPTGAKAAAAQGIPPPAAAAPPGKPPAPPTGGVLPITPAGPNIPPYVEPPMMGKNVLGMKPIQAGLSKSEEIANIARRTLGKVGIRLVEDNPLVSGAFKERARLKSVADSQAGRLSTKHGTALGKAFTLDKQGRVTNLAGVDSTLPGAPTIQDVAARLPRYWGNLSSEQQQAMLVLRRDVTPYRSLLDEVGVEVPARADVIEGGFYLPRGRADLEGADLPLKVATGLGRSGKRGFERPAVFESQAAGIDAGYEYPSITDTLSAYARDAGNRATDAHIATFFKTATDETGQLLGNTPKIRLMQQNPAIATKMQVLKDSLDRLKRLSASLTKRQLEVIDKWQLDPTFDDLDVLLDGLKTMRGGRGAGMTAPEMQTALTATRQAIRTLAPEYKVALRRAQATPRLEGAVGLPGMQGWAFPDEIANAANFILKGEGPPTGLAAAPIAVANAFNNLYRGLRATFDNSAVGIQGLLGAADDPIAYGKALGVNFRAWGRGGERALGRYISQFDQAASQAGRLTSDDWARANLRIGGAQTEFQLGAGVSEKLTRLPVVRQANRAFGYFGDALRLDWADDMLEAELRRGRSVQELWDAGDVQRIADISNNMTGWAQGKAFGSMGDLLLFAPRFLQARAETLVKGVAGLRPGASIGQRAARRSLLKMIGYGTLLTVAANEMLGNETDFRPIIKVRRRNDWQYTWNPNFMRIRLFGRDYTLFGTWDSFARAITVTAMGRPQEALRGLGSGVVSDAWDIIGDRDFDGNKVRDNPLNFVKWLITSMIPFATEEVPGITAGGIEAARSGAIAKVGGAAVVIGGEAIGAKSSPITLKDKLGITDQDLAPYFDIPTNLKPAPKTIYDYFSSVPTDPRLAYRKAHPEMDAKLFLRGAVSSLEDTTPWGAAFQATVRLMRENNIRVEDIKGLEVKKYTDGSVIPNKLRDDLMSFTKEAKVISRPVATPSSAGTMSERDQWRIALGLPPVDQPEPTPVGAR